MRVDAVMLAAALLATPSIASAQNRFGSRPVEVSSPTHAAVPIVTVAPVAIDDQDGDTSLAAIQHESEHIVERLRPLEDRLRSDDRLRRTGTIVGVAAVALGAVRGTAPLTFAGTQAIRIGLQRQLSAVERRTGFEIQPSIGHRRVAVTVNKTFR